MENININKEGITQEDIYNSHTTARFLGRWFTCPGCKSEWGGELIENEDSPEEKPQIYCPYGCGYIFLDLKEDRNGK